MFVLALFSRRLGNGHNKGVDGFMFGSAPALGKGPDSLGSEFLPFVCLSTLFSEGISCNSLASALTLRGAAVRLCK
jgi:hypothetical protein